MDRVNQRCCLSEWFPKLAAVPGVKVPRTEVLHAGIDLTPLCDGKEPDGWPAFLARLRAACGRAGYPCFLRTGQGSGKHEWSECCHVTSPADLPRRVAALVEWSHMVDFLGLPTDVWAVREFLTLDVAFTLPGYCWMPLAREFRFFVEGGAVLCQHPYWPEVAVEQGRPADPGWREKLAAFNRLPPDEWHRLWGMASAVSGAFDGAWSVDFARHSNGDWYAIDMALAERSFHWDGCPVPAEKGWAR
jgi:hypothetical protein